MLKNLCYPPRDGVGMVRPIPFSKSWDAPGNRSFYRWRADIPGLPLGLVARLGCVRVDCGINEGVGTPEGRSQWRPARNLPSEKIACKVIQGLNRTADFAAAASRLRPAKSAFHRVSHSDRCRSQDRYE